MSIIPPNLNKLLQFYLSAPLPCPYLPDRVERKLFTRLSGNPITDTIINGTLTCAGFRRSHELLYRPACPSCNACIPVRIPAALFTPSRSLRRIAAHNRDLVFEITTAKATEEQFELFTRYQHSRHTDSDMANMTRSEFVGMVEDGGVDTQMIHLRTHEGVLMGCAIIDCMPDGLSAMYSFFDPDQPHRSLGFQLILSLITETIRRKLDYVYLGYWIAESRKMAYKSRFKPMQALGMHGWDWIKTE